MPKIHYFPRYSTLENTVTNNTLLLFGRIYDYSVVQVSKVLSDITGVPVEIGLEFNQQARHKGSIPDGAIIQRSFKLLIETKVEAAVDADQLRRHADGFSDESQKILLLLTKQEIGSEVDEISRALAASHPGVLFRAATFEGVCRALQGLFKDHEEDMTALVEDYALYCNEMGLFDQSRYLMRIAACGDTLALNKHYGIYFNPRDKGYTKHAYVGVYAKKTVQALWAIDSVFDADWDGSTLKKTLVDGRETHDYDEKLIGIINDAKTQCGFDIHSGRRFFCGVPVETDYRKASPGGLMAATYVNLRKVLGDFATPQEVAERLRGHQWE